MSCYTQSYTQKIPLTAFIHNGLLALIALAAIASIAPLAAQAQVAADRIDFSIPPGPLEQSLSLFAAQTGIAISMDAASKGHK